MIENDVQLIRRILSGDDEAFNTLVHQIRIELFLLLPIRTGCTLLPTSSESFKSRLRGNR